MPKAKPTQVITHRIELQAKEREMLEQVVMTNTISKGVPALIAAGGIGLAGFGLYLFLQEVYGFKDTATKVWDAIKNPFTIEPLTPEQKEAARANTNDGNLKVTGTDDVPFYKDNMFWEMYEGTREEWGI